MKKTVIELITTLGNGGAETLVKDYSLLINKNLFNYKLVIIRDLPNSVNSKILNANKIPYQVIFKKWNFFMKVIYRFFGDFYIERKLSKIVKDAKPDCIHFHLPRNLKYIKNISKKLKNIKLFFTIHSEPRYYFEDAKVYKNIKYIAENNDLTLIALHNKMKKEIIEKYYFTNTICLYNGINIDRFEKCDIDKNTIRRQLNINENAFVIGHVGRFTLAKNHSFLIDIFEIILKLKSDAVLLLVGNGELYDEVVCKIKEKNLYNNVMILSNRTDIPELLKSMDLFLFPSKYEGLPLSVIEAQMTGLNCLVSNQIPEESFISNNVCVKSLNVGAEEWANSAVQFKSNITPYNSKNDFDIKQIVKKLEKIYLM